MKVRVELMPNEIETFIKNFEKIFQIISVSKPYKNRNSELVRVYIEFAKE